MPAPCCAASAASGSDSDFPAPHQAQAGQPQAQQGDGARFGHRANVEGVVHMLVSATSGYINGIYDIDTGPPIEQVLTPTNRVMAAVSARHRQERSAGADVKQCFRSTSAAPVVPPYTIVSKLELLIAWRIGSSEVAEYKTPPPPA